MPQETSTANFTNQRDVLLAVQDILLSDLSDMGFNEASIFITDDGEPPAQLRQKLFLTLSPSDAEFPDDVQTGGGAATVEGLAGFRVTIFSALKVDQGGRFPVAVYDPDQGLYEIMRRVMKALVGVYPERNGLPLLSDCIKIRRTSSPMRDDKGNYFVTMEFGTPFFWDLT